MFEVDFAGWYECRLSTDPDAFDDPRGQFGWTFAMPGEPDMDRVIRFQGPVASRSHGPMVGVNVKKVRVNGSDDPLHSLEEPIVPWVLQIQNGDVNIVGRDPIDLSDPADVFRRQPIEFVGNSPAVAAATGITDRAKHRQDRRVLLEADLATETDPIRRAALEKRIEELGKASIRVTSLGFQLTYEFDLRGPNEWNDDGSVLGVCPAKDANWSVRFWMGGWDADALCGYVLGTLRVA